MKTWNNHTTNTVIKMLCHVKSYGLLPTTSPATLPSTLPSTPTLPSTLPAHNWVDWLIGVRRRIASAAFLKSAGCGWRIWTLGHEGARTNGVLSILATELAYLSVQVPLALVVEASRFQNAWSVARNVGRVGHKQLDGDLFVLGRLLHEAHSRRVGIKTKVVVLFDALQRPGNVRRDATASRTLWRSTRHTPCPPTGPGLLLHCH